jgi:RadC-like JAB domain
LASRNYRSAHNASGNTVGSCGGAQPFVRRAGLDSGDIELPTAFNSYSSDMASSSREKIVYAKCSSECESGICHDSLESHQREGYLVTGAIISSPSAIVRYLNQKMSHLTRETFRLLYLDTRNRLIADETLWEGTVDHVHIYPREVVRRAIETGATALIMAHNHPHGDPSPSRHDVAITNRLERACDTIDVRIHDHLIVGKHGWFSMAEASLLTRFDNDDREPSSIKPLEFRR